MKKRKLSTQLSRGFAMIAFVVFGLVSISANLLIKNRFEDYMEREQQEFASEIANNIANQFDAVHGRWNMDYIHNMGMYTVNDGYFLKILDTQKNTV